MTFYPNAPQQGLSLVQKLFRLNWALVLLIFAIAVTGFLMLYSVAGGDMEPWAGRQMARFGVGLGLMLVIGLIDIRFWRWFSPVAYLGGLALLVAVEFIGVSGGGAQRWLDLGPLQLQPSELMKIGLVMALASYYAWLENDRVSHPLWVLPPLVLVAIPMLLVLKQPDLGTALLLGMGGALVMFLAGVSWWYWGTILVLGGSIIFAVFESKGTDWQILKDYQYK
ncbi:MAG: FtsW/RodA/SpoVE family cell cycle protein, partial [Paracoccaceae bacterium]